MPRPDPFLVHVDEIPAAGLLVECELPEGWLAALLPAAYKAARKGGVVNFTAILADDTVQVTGKISASVQFDCGRCARNLEMPMERSISVVFVPESNARMKFDPEFEEQPPEDLCTYAGRTFSVEAPFVDAVVLSLTPFPVCRTDCKGLCLRCGEDLNESACTCGEGPDLADNGSANHIPLADAVALLREKFERKRSGAK